MKSSSSFVDKLRVKYTSIQIRMKQALFIQKPLSSKNHFDPKTTFIQKPPSSKNPPLLPPPTPDTHPNTPTHKHTPKHTHTQTHTQTHAHRHNTHRHRHHHLTAFIPKPLSSQNHPSVPGLHPSGLLLLPTHTPRAPPPPPPNTLLHMKAC